MEVCFESYSGDLINIMNELCIYLAGYLLLIIAGVFVFRFLVRRDYRRRGRLSVGVTFLQSLLFFTYGGFPTIYMHRDWPKVRVGWFLHGFGLLLLTAGLLFLLLWMIRLGVLTSLGRGMGHLETKGIYRYTRNPQAIACGLFVLGFSLLWPSWFALGWALLYGFLIHLMVLTEEEHLARQFGEDYQAYCSSVPRYLGFRKLRSSKR
jgi:protein-S-isoprenylcysteine O-methyltransferase Ste14